MRPDTEEEIVSHEPDEETPGEDAELPSLTIEGAEELIQEATAAQESRSDGGAVSELEAKVAELEEKLSTTKDLLVRRQADFDNFRRRVLKERQDNQNYGHENFVKELLPVVDNLERALEHAKENEGAEILTGLLEGVELVSRELLGCLQKNGVKPIEAAGKMFDPTVHEAMGQAPDGSVPPNTVVQVFQNGYELRDHLLRPARVIVAMAPPEGTAEPAASEETQADEENSSS
jgi:molecular chaperone GrpE